MPILIKERPGCLRARRGGVESGSPSTDGRHARVGGPVGRGSIGLHKTGRGHHNLGPPTRDAYGTPAPTLDTTTPEQTLARLAQLEQLTNLHRSGTLSDAEYDAAKGRLSGG